MVEDKRVLELENVISEFRMTIRDIEQYVHSVDALIGEFNKKITDIDERVKKVEKEMEIINLARELIKRLMV